jgi:hypothetical protein
MRRFNFGQAQGGSLHETRSQDSLTLKLGKEIITPGILEKVHP